jgi:hypothetical protein
VAPLTRVLILGVNPFEDLPGYQLLSLLRSSGHYEIVAADDSVPALEILSVTGARIELLPHPNADPCHYTSCVARLCEDCGIDVLLPGSDAPLYALSACLAEAPQLARLCPTLTWLASKSLSNKWDIQAWASDFAMTPPRWTFDDEREAAKFADKGMYPLMVKGLRKGASKCDDPLEATVFRRALLRNPANQGPTGGTYVESFVDGEERSLFLLTGTQGKCLVTFGVRKLATTQLGTTVAAQVDTELPSEIDVSRLLSQISCPAAVELEWRKDSAGTQWLFEVNFRFPSWVGSLGTYGLSVVEAYVDSVQQSRSHDARVSTAPPEGSIFYRLPQSGFLPMEAAFGAASASSRPTGIMARYSRPAQLLWTSMSPHQFRVK